MGDQRQAVDRDGRHQPLYELATRQHGVVSTRQLAAIGYGKNSASKANGTGRLRRIYRGVYAVGHEPLTWEGRCMAAVLAARPAVASHLAAGWLWDLLRYRPERIAVTAPTARRARRDFRVHFGVLSPPDIAAIDGIPVSSFPRTTLDLAATLSPPSFEGVLERSEELGLFDLTAIEDVWRRYAHHPGVGPLRQALSIYVDDPRVTRSRLERRFLALVREAGLPQPSMNYNVAGFELDAYWERERFAVELDVFETHGTRAAFERDRVRADDLLAHGVEMIRVTGPRLKREPEAVIRRLTEHLARRRRERA